MNETKSILPAKIGGAEITRFNALRHGVLSRYTVLPWKDAAEYRDLVASLVAEHAPQGPTEEHLVEDLADLLRQAPLALGQSAAHRHRLEDALSQSRRMRRERWCISTLPTDLGTRRSRTRHGGRDGGRPSATCRRTRPSSAEARPAQLAPQRPLRGRAAALREDTRQWWADR